VPLICGRDVNSIVGNGLKMDRMDRMDWVDEVDKVDKVVVLCDVI